MANENFTNYSRSTAFSLSLSGPMVDKLLEYGEKERARDIADELSTRYDWYCPTALWPPFFNNKLTVEEMFAQVTGTTRALIRRGLLEIRETNAMPGWSKARQLSEDDEEHGEHVLGVPAVVISEPGRIMCLLLKEAGFEPQRSAESMVPKIHRHRDDHPTITVYADGWNRPAAKHDRRRDLMQPGDEQYFGVGSKWDADHQLAES